MVRLIMTILYRTGIGSRRRTRPGHVLRHARRTGRSRNGEDNTADNEESRRAARARLAVHTVRDHVETGGQYRAHSTRSH